LPVPFCGNLSNSLQFQGFVQPSPQNGIVAVEADGRMPHHIGRERSQEGASAWRDARETHAMADRLVSAVMAGAMSEAAQE